MFTVQSLESARPGPGSEPSGGAAVEVRPAPSARSPPAKLVIPDIFCQAGRGPAPNGLPSPSSERRHSESVAERGRGGAGGGAHQPPPPRPKSESGPGPTRDSHAKLTCNGTKGIFLVAQQLYILVCVFFLSLIK